jgi:hypothetical protein
MLLLAVMNSRSRSLPPKQMLAVHDSGGAIGASLLHARQQLPINLG